MLRYSVPPGKQRQKPTKRPNLGPWQGVIDAILAEDKLRPAKQRHTAKRILERLRAEHHYTDGYTIVKDYVRSSKVGSQEMFVPLAHAPSEAQADFGEALVVIAGVEQKAHLLAIDCPHSDDGFLAAFRGETMEACQQGHVLAFKYFGAVPRRILYDKNKIAVARILGGEERTKTKAFLELESHYLFADKYRRPGKRNDKPGPHRQAFVRGVEGKDVPVRLLAVNRGNEWQPTAPLHLRSGLHTDGSAAPAGPEGQCMNRSTGRYDPPEAAQDRGHCAGQRPPRGASTQFSLSGEGNLRADLPAPLAVEQSSILTVHQRWASTAALSYPDLDLLRPRMDAMGPQWLLNGTQWVRNGSSLVSNGDAIALPWTDQYLFGMLCVRISHQWGCYDSGWEHYVPI